MNGTTRRRKIARKLGRRIRQNHRPRCQSGSEASSRTHETTSTEEGAVQNASHRAAGDTAQTLACARHLQKPRGRRSANSSRKHTQGYAEPSFSNARASGQSCGYNSLRCAWHCGTGSDTQVYATVRDKTNAMNRLPLRSAKILLIERCHCSCDHPQTLQKTIPEAVGSTRPVRAIWQLQRRSITIWRRPRGHGLIFATSI